jgi:hypothetical protein
MHAAMAQVTEGYRVIERVRTSHRPWNDVVNVQAPVGRELYRRNVTANLAPVSVTTKRKESYPPPFAAAIHNRSPSPIVVWHQQ